MTSNLQARPKERPSQGDEHRCRIPVVIRYGRSMLEQPPPRLGRCRFGVFETDLRAGELRKCGIRIKLQSQPFKLLTILLYRAGEIVSREELQQQIWGSETVVNFDHSLGTAINKVREALGDSAENPRYIETLDRKSTRLNS